MSEKIKYEPVGDNTSDFEDGIRKPTQKSWVPTVTSFLLGLVTMAAAVAIYTTLLHQHGPSHARQIPHARNGSDPDTGLPLAWSHGDCGNSPADALARGCKYSIVLHSWLPESCLTEEDEKDAVDMYRDRTWTYKTSDGRNLTMDELAMGDYWFFGTSFDWHVTHCMYVWKRLHRILLDPSQELDSYTANYHHTSHCVEMIGGHPGGMKDSGTQIFVKYPKCAK